MKPIITEFQDRKDEDIHIDRDTFVAVDEVAFRLVGAGAFATMSEAYRYMVAEAYIINQRLEQKIKTLEKLERI